MRLSSVAASASLLLILGAIGGCSSSPSFVESPPEAELTGAGDVEAEGELDVGITERNPANSPCSDFVTGDNEQPCSRGPRTFPTNGEPARQIRFDSPAAADAKRQELVRYIWSDGLPTTVLPEVTKDVAFPKLALGIDPGNVSSVDRLDATISGYHVMTLVMHPKNRTNADRVVIVHQGHARDLVGGVGVTANHLLERGFTVLPMKMPLYGWSSDSVAKPPGQQELDFKSHDAMFAGATVFKDGRMFRLFLEPIVQTINHVMATKPKLVDISMIGLSGGGWSTSMMSAIDPRIHLSVPVAGSAPLYHRNVDAKSVGDHEQYHTPLYNEAIRPDGSGGGIATWLEIYALGAYGVGREQIQVNNELDPCCFGGRFADSYKTIVAGKVSELGLGRWSHVLDPTHKEHRISDYVIETVIDPLLGIVPGIETRIPGAGPVGLPGPLSELGETAWTFEHALAP